MSHIKLMRLRQRWQPKCCRLHVQLLRGKAFCTNGITAILACSVDTNNAFASTGTIAPTRVLVSSGVMTTAAKVLTVVIITLSATSAFARKVTTLLAVPPGQLATKQILKIK